MAESEEGVTSMKKSIIGIAIVALLVAILCGSANAADQWSDWGAKIQAAIDRNKVATDTVATKIRDVRCPQQPTQAARNACVAAYNVSIAQAETERAEMELKVAAISLPTAQRDQILQNILSGYEAFNKETMAMGDQFDLLFPIPQQSSEK